MEKAIRFIKRTGIFFVAILPSLAIICLISIKGNFFRDIIPLPSYLQIAHVTFGIVCGFFSILIFALFFIFLIIPKRTQPILQKISIFVGILVGIPIWLIFCLMFSNLTETIQNTAQLENHHFFLTIRTYFDAYPNYYLYKCNEMDVECVFTKVYSGGVNFGPSELVIDKQTNEIHIFISPSMYEELVYTYGLYPHDYKYIDGGWVDPYTF